MVDSKENYKFDYEPTILQSPWKRITSFLLVILSLASFFSRLLSLVSWHPSWQFIVCFCFFFSNSRLRRRLFSCQWPGFLSCRTLDDWVPTRWRLLQSTEKWRIVAPLKLWGHCFCELRTKICCYVLVQNVQEIVTSNKATRRYKIEVGETQSFSDSRRKRKWHFVVVQDEDQRTHKTIPWNKDESQTFIWNRRFGDQNWDTAAVWERFQHPASHIVKYAFEHGFLTLQD